MSGTLYLVSTPIGNLKDISFRAIETLNQSDLIVCEDSRQTKKLLNHYDIKKPLFSLFQGQEKKRSQKVYDDLLEGKIISLVTDAGTPVIQDPGFVLVRLCVENDIPVVSIPGPTALISALSISGLPTDRFIFEGFLPVKPGQKRKRIESWKSEERTIVFYESCHKIEKNLAEIQNILGDIELVVARELTKKFEELKLDKISNFINQYKKQKPKGEFVIVISLKKKADKNE